MLLETHHAPSLEIAAKQGAHDLGMIVDGMQSAVLDPVAGARLSVATAPSGQDRLAAMTEKTTIAYDVQPAISPRSEPEQAAQTPDALAKALASNPRFVVLPPSGKGYIIGQR
jgi:hypothetical protein